MGHQVNTTWDRGHRLPVNAPAGYHDEQSYHTGGKDAARVPPVLLDATRANTIAHLSRASRTEYWSNQIGQFSANKVRAWIGLREPRREERQIGRDKTLAGSGRRTREEKWFNFTVVFLQPSHQGGSPFSISLSHLINLSVWVGLASRCVWDDRSWGPDKPQPRTWERGNVQKLLSHRASSSSNNTSEGQRGIWQSIWLQQTGCMIVFSSSPAVHSAFSPLPRVETCMRVRAVRSNTAADACCSAIAADATDFVYSIHNPTADVYKFLEKKQPLCARVCVCSRKKEGEPVFCGQLEKTNENWKAIWREYKRRPHFP